MTQLTRHQIEKAKMLKACRMAVRLKYTLMADEELYKRLPELEKRIDTALLGGKALRITAAELLDAHA